jgi:hypothetical protein
MKLAELESALLESMRTAPALSYLRTVEPVSERSFDFARGDFVVVPPAVLSFFLAGALRSRDLSARTYDYHPRFLLFAVARNLRGVAEEKLGGPVAGEVGAYQILHDLKSTLAGARLAAGGGSSLPLVELAAEQLEAFTPECSVYSLEILIRGTFHV